jgi:regulator of protease activity HflC (stomatin/prohibitin superfamily)
VGTVSLRVKELSVQIETKTKDNVFVHMGVIVQYKVKDSEIFQAFYALVDAQKQLMSYILNNVRGRIPNYEIDELFTAKDEIAAHVKNDLEMEFNQFGFSIIQTLITDIDPADTVKKAMNEINAARRMRDATKDRAEADRIQKVKAAEADSESKRLSGVGIAEQRKAVVTGLHDSIVTFSNAGDVSHQEVMQLLLMNQYFDTLKDMTAHSERSTMFVPHSPNAVENLSKQLHSCLQGTQGTKKIA